MSGRRRESIGIWQYKSNVVGSIDVALVMIYFVEKDIGATCLVIRRVVEEASM